MRARLPNRRPTAAQPPACTRLFAPPPCRCRREGGAGCLIPQKLDAREWGGASLWPPGKRVARLAFGSCAAYDDRAQPLWEASVVPAQPDAWVWLGDMFYADEPAFSCSGANANASQCQVWRWGRCRCLAARLLPPGAPADGAPARLPPHACVRSARPTGSRRRPTCAWLATWTMHESE